MTPYKRSTLRHDVTFGDVEVEAFLNTMADTLANPRNLATHLAIWKTIH